MYIVKEADEDTINKATELADKQSKRLASTIKDILALRGKNKLSVEIIEEAIDVVDGKKKLTDLVPCRVVGGIAYVRPKDNLQTDFVVWGVPGEFARDFETWGDPAEFARDFETWGDPAKKHRLEVRSLILATKAKRAPSCPLHYSFKHFMVHIGSKNDKLLERRMLLVRNR